LLATTKQFLDDLGLASLEQLPLLAHTAADGEPLAEALAMQASLLDVAAEDPAADPVPASDPLPLDPPEEPAADAASMEPHA
jgi:segregation and condensation protein B